MDIITIKLLEKHTILPLDVIRYINKFIKYKELDDSNIRHAVTMWYFYKHSALQVYGHISYWDTSRITNMSSLFYRYYNFNEDISRWNVSNVRTMSEMFYEAISFNCDLSNWDVRNVKDMTCMFCFTKLTHFDFMTIFGCKKVPQWYST